jgi:hypothetical protein
MKEKLLLEKIEHLEKLMEQLRAEVKRIQPIVVYPSYPVYPQWPYYPNTPMYSGDPNPYYPNTQSVMTTGKQTPNTF